jgi:hypothetical protein
MRKIAVASLSMLLLFCGAVKAAKPRTNSLAYRTVQSGNAAFIQSSQPRAFIGWNEVDYQSFWSSIVGSSTPPKIDFRTEQPIVLCAGSQPTAGWDIRVESARFEKDVVIVVAPIIAPPKDMRVAQVISYPYVLIAVPTKKGRKVRWLDRSGRDIELTGGPANQ